MRGSISLCLFELRQTLFISASYLSVSPASSVNTLLYECLVDRTKGHPSGVLP